MNPRVGLNLGGVALRPALAVTLLFWEFEFQAIGQSGSRKESLTRT